MGSISYEGGLRMNGIRVGDLVRVKTGVKDPDFDIDIGGWQGRVLYETAGLPCILWDSITLAQMPKQVFDRSEEENLDWRSMYLEPDDVYVIVRADELGEYPY